MQIKSKVVTFPTSVLSLLQQVDMEQRPDKKSRQSFAGAPAAVVGSKNMQQVPLLALPFRRSKWSENRGVSRGLAGGVA